MNFLDFREPVNAWSHGIWLLLAPPATVLLWRRRADRAMGISFLIFGACAAACFGASTLFHGARTSERSLRVFARIDYIGIYLMIAGTVTPMAWTLLQGPWRRNALGLIWGSAALGIGLNLGLGSLPLSISTAFYLGMGWGAVLCYVEIARVLPHRALLWIVIGGLFYTVGAMVNLLEWPSPWPGRFGFHEIFHLLVMAGSFSHFWFILRVVAPYRPERFPARPAPPTVRAPASAPVPLPMP